MPFKNGKLACICEICNCGRHRCPHRYIVDAPLEGLSEYNNEYIQKHIDRIPSCKPAPQLLHTDKPLSDVTTNRVDFIPHEIQRPHRHNADPYVKPEGDMDGTTMYRNEFNDKKGVPAKLVKRDTIRRNPGKFDGENTYRTDYRKWDMPDRVLAVGKDRYTPPKDPFTGLPTYRRDFIPHRLTPTHSCKPDFSILRSSAPLADMTDYRQSYVPHPLQQKLAKDESEWIRPTVPLEGLTTSQKDFTPKTANRVESCKPRFSFLQSTHPLQSNTTHRTDFIPYDMKKPELHNPDPYKPYEGDMDLSTTYGRDYPQHASNKVPIIRPRDKRQHVGPFEGITDYQENFRTWEPSRRQLMGPKNQTFAGDQPFEGMSTHRQHFIQHPRVHTKAIKPTQSVLMSEQPLEGCTSYRTEYTPKYVSPCPVILLNTNASRHVFQEQDPSGHKFYASRA